MLGGHPGVACRIMITLRFRVRYEREIRRKQTTESFKAFEGRTVPKKKRHLESIVFKGFIFSYFFS